MGPHEEINITISNKLTFMLVSRLKLICDSTQFVGLLSLSSSLIYLKDIPSFVLEVFYVLQSS